MGLRYSSSRISPEWMGGSRSNASVVVADFDVIGVTFLPSNAYPRLIAAKRGHTE
jgi:hypothetical protein